MTIVTDIGKDNLIQSSAYSLFCELNGDESQDYFLEKTYRHVINAEALSYPCHLRKIWSIAFCKCHKIRSHDTFNS